MKLTKHANQNVLTNSEIESQKEYPNQKPPMLEYKIDWLNRHAKHYKQGNDWVFYHSTPKDTFKTMTVLLEGSLMTDSMDDAIHFATCNRDLTPEDVIVLKLTLQPNEFNTGVFPTIDQDIPIESSKIQIV